MENSVTRIAMKIGGKCVVIGLTTALSLASSVLLVGCPGGGRQVPPPAESQSDLIHKVSYEGETLALISAWYTGSAKNWNAILDHNPGLDIHRMRLGDEIRIPRSMVTKSEPLPKKAVGNVVSPKRAPVNGSTMKQPTKTADTGAVGGEPTSPVSQEPIAGGPDEPVIEIPADNGSAAAVGNPAPGAQAATSPAKNGKTRYDLLKDLLEE